MTRLLRRGTEEDVTALYLWGMLAILFQAGNSATPQSLSLSRKLSKATKQVVAELWGSQGRFAGLPSLIA